MNCQDRDSLACGIETMDAGSRRDGAANPLERLAGLMLDNERLMAELATSRGRVVDARVYLDSPGCHRPFAEAHLDRCRAKHSAVLAALRANRIEAMEILEAPGAVA